MADDNAAIVTAFLRGKPGRYYCHSCVSENTGVRPASQVNKVLLPLGNTGEWRYTDTQCDGCGRSRKCIKFAGD